MVSAPRRVRQHVLSKPSPAMPLIVTPEAYVVSVLPKNAQVATMNPVKNHLGTKPSVMAMAIQSHIALNHDYQARS